MLLDCYPQSIGHQRHRRRGGVSEPFLVDIAVHNSGRAAWLAKSERDVGAIHLGWRWVRGVEEVGTGREALKYDVHPGQDYSFSARIVRPRAAGIIRSNSNLSASILPGSPTSVPPRSGYRCACFPSDERGCGHRDGDRTATTVDPMAFGFDSSVTPCRQDTADVGRWGFAPRSDPWAGAG
jgi:hypothetical protein